MMLAHHELGGTGPALLILHGNAIPGMVYQIMVQQVLGAHFRCVAVDAPGQGSSPAWDHDAQPLTVDAIVSAEYDTICRLGLKGCYVFGHSMGGLLALKIEAQHPGTFAAIYVFEPAAVSAASAEDVMKWEEANGVHTKGVMGHVLAQMAMARPSSWQTREAAAAYLRSSLPFSVYHPDAFEAFVQSGIRPVQSAAQGHNAGEQVELCCSNRMQAAVFYCFEPLPQFDQSKVRCPVLCAGSTVAMGGHNRLAHTASVIAQDLPSGTYHSFEGLSHFGPVEQPKEVAAHVLAFFQSCQK